VTLEKGVNFVKKNVIVLIIVLIGLVFACRYTYNQWRKMHPRPPAMPAGGMVDPSIPAQ